MARDCGGERYIPARPLASGPVGASNRCERIACARVRGAVHATAGPAGRPLPSRRAAVGSPWPARCGGHAARRPCTLEAGRRACASAPAQACRPARRRAPRGQSLSARCRHGAQVRAIAWDAVGRMRGDLATPLLRARDAAKWAVSARTHSPRELYSQLWCEYSSQSCGARPWLAASGLLSLWGGCGACALGRAARPSSPPAQLGRVALGGSTPDRSDRLVNPGRPPWQFAAPAHPRRAPCRVFPLGSSPRPGPRAQTLKFNRLLPLDLKESLAFLAIRA